MKEDGQTEKSGGGGPHLAPGTGSGRRERSVHPNPAQAKGPEPPASVSLGLRTQ